MTDILHLLSTPIGNLEDISQRGLKTLESADCIVAEDTRVTKKLIELLGLTLSGKQFFSFHEHNQNEVGHLVGKVRDFKTVVLVSDAGCPVMSDPGFPFVQEWIQRGGEVTSVPGPSSVNVALELSGLPPVPFSFHGFLPKKKEAKGKIFKSLNGGETHVFFESPHRIKDTVEEVFKSLPDCEIAVGRELTKKFEEVLRFTSSTWEERKGDLKEKGEFVLLIHHKESSVSSSADFVKAKELAEEYMKKPSSKKLAKLISQLTGDEISAVYDSLKR